MEVMRISRLTGVVLAGGRGQRMGGADKGLSLLDGRPLVAHVIDRLRPQVDEVILNANRNLDTYSGLGYPVVPDADLSFAGPLAGLRAALAYSSAWVLTVPCDAPLFPADLAGKLKAGLETQRKNVAVARTVDGAQPVFCLTHRDVLAGLDAFLASGGRRFGAWLAEVGTCEVDFEDTAAFVNLNSMADLDSASRMNRGAGA